MQASSSFLTLFLDFQFFVQEFWLWCQQKNYSALNLFGFRFKTRIYLVWKLVGGEKKYRSWRLKDAVFNWVETDHISAPSRGEIYWGPSQLLSQSWVLTIVIIMIRVFIGLAPGFKPSIQGENPLIIVSFHKWTTI